MNKINKTFIKFIYFYLWIILLLFFINYIQSLYTNNLLEWIYIVLWFICLFFITIIEFPLIIFFTSISIWYFDVFYNISTAEFGTVKSLTLIWQWVLIIFYFLIFNVWKKLHGMILK